MDAKLMALYIRSKHHQVQIAYMIVMSVKMMY